MLTTSNASYGIVDNIRSLVVSNELCVFLLVYILQIQKKKKIVYTTSKTIGSIGEKESWNGLGSKGLQRSSNFRLPASGRVPN